MRIIRGLSADRPPPPPRLPDPTQSTGTHVTGSQAPRSRSCRSRGHHLLPQRRNNACATSPATIHTQLVGDYNLPNVLVAVAVGKHFDVSDARIYQSIEQYTPSNKPLAADPPGWESYHPRRIQCEPIKHARGYRKFCPIGRLPATAFDQKILVLGAMAELGSESINEHRAIVKLIGQYPWHQVALVGGDFEKIEHPYLRFGDSKGAGHWLSNAGFKNIYMLIKARAAVKWNWYLGSRARPRICSAAATFSLSADAPSWM